MLKPKKWIVVGNKLYSKKRNRNGLHIIAKVSIYGEYQRLGFATHDEFKKAIKNKKN